jgi:hypothetical protein
MRAEHGNLSCYRCGASLAGLSLPLARLDECPECRVELHVCRMCTRYAPRLAKGCDEDDAPDVRDKAAANFCDYFKPDPAAYQAADRDAEAAARAQLGALFGDDPSEPSQAQGSEQASSPDDEARRLADSLFKK